jgi:T5SS/PEP-CTERM-associated repeat protein
VLAGLGCALGLMIASPGRAVTTSWNTNVDGLYNVGGNWSNGVPVAGAGNVAVFDRGPAISYAVTFPAGTTNLPGAVVVRSNAVTFQRFVAGAHLSLPNNSGWTIGDNAGDVGVLNLDLPAMSLATLDLGDAPGSSGTLNVSHEGALTTAFLGVGGGGDGTLNAAEGAEVAANVTYLGATAGSHGKIAVSGVGSAFSTGDLSFGDPLTPDPGLGLLEITAGGSVTSQSVRQDTGFSMTDPQEAIVSGSSSSWTVIGPLEIAHRGFGRVSIVDGGSLSVTATQTTIALGPQSTGKLTVSGVGSQMTSSNLRIGDYGAGEFEVLGGATADTGSDELGYRAEGVGTATVDGAGSTWTNLGNLFVGRNGQGTVNVTGGGHLVTGFNTFIGFEPGSKGTVNVVGPGSRLTSTVLRVGGNYGSSALNISGGAKVTSMQGYIAHSGPATGMVTIDGVGSSWTMSGGLTIGDFGAGQVALANEATLQAASILIGANGVLRGNGHVIGSVTNGGKVLAGAAQGALTIDEDYAQTAGGELVIDIATALAYGRLDVEDNAVLGGKLTVNLLAGFRPSGGQTFTILTADDVDPGFTSFALPSDPHLKFQVIYHPLSVELYTITADFDNDSDVDGADLVVWRGAYRTSSAGDADNDGDSDGADFLQWQRQLGHKSPTGQVAATAAVPEPAGAWLASMASLATLRICRRRLSGVGQAFQPDIDDSRRMSGWKA